MLFGSNFKPLKDEEFFVDHPNVPPSWPSTSQTRGVTQLPRLVVDLLKTQLCRIMPGQSKSVKQGCVFNRLSPELLIKIFDQLDTDVNHTTDPGRYTQHLPEAKWEWGSYFRLCFLRNTNELPPLIIALRGQGSAYVEALAHFRDANYCFHLSNKNDFSFPGWNETELTCVRRISIDFEYYSCILFCLK